MKHCVKYLLPLLLLIITVLETHAAVHEVTSTGDSYVSGEFRYEIENASSGDTVFVNVAGIVSLTSSITVPGGINLTIIGPFPAHFAIDGAGFTGTQVFNTSGSKLEILNLAFTNFQNSQFFNYSTAASDSLLVKSCLFENNVTGGSGSILISTNPNLASWFDACSFIGNSSSTDGGCFQIGTNSTITGGNLMFTNCTFNQNSAGAGNGGAIYLGGGSLDLYNNTFHTNSANYGSSLVVYTGSCYLQNNIFHNPTTPSGQIGYNVACYDGGGNVTNDNTANFWVNVFGMNPLPSNVSGAFPLLYSNIYQDGYGLKYFPIADSSSVCININNMSPATIYDGRKNWRRMGSGVDAGAIEFSKYTVKAPTDWGPVMSLYANETTPAAIVFEGSGQVSYAGVSTLYLHVPTIINGYNQQGSKVPGPGATQGTVTPATTNVVLTPGTITSGSLISVSSDSCVLSGLSLIGSSNNLDGISIVGVKNTIVTGCHIGVGTQGLTANGLNRGVVLTNNATTGFTADNNFIGNNTYVGGVKRNNRNVISGNSDYQIYIHDGKYNLISNNFIGLNSSANDIPADAALSYSSTTVWGTYGIYFDYSYNTTLDSASFNVIGGLEPDDRNIISGFPSEAISINNSGGNQFINNFIGTDYNGNAGGNFDSLSVQSGFYIYGATDNIIGLPGAGNVIGNFSQYGIDCDYGSKHSVIKGNNIGLGKDGVANIKCNYPDPYTSNAPEGIYISSSLSNKIGGNISSERNYIVNNHTGIDFYGYGGDMDTVYGNFIGLRPDSMPAPNSFGISFYWGASGIKIGDTIPGYGNVIAFNDTSGIFSDNGDYFQVSGNSIYNNGGATGLGIDLYLNYDTTTYSTIHNTPNFGYDSIFNHYYGYYDNDGIFPPKLISMVDCDGLGNLSVLIQANNYTSNSADTMVVEFYLADADHQEGKRFIGSKQIIWVDSTDQFYVNLPPVTPALTSGDYIVATATKKSIGFDGSTGNSYLTKVTSEFSASITFSPAPAFTATYNPVSCYGDNNGSINLNVTSGTGPFDIYFNSIYFDTTSSLTYTIDSLTYMPNVSVGIMASGCPMLTSTGAITQPDSISLGLTPQNPSCYGAFDGGVNVNLAGGTSPYVYTINSNTTVNSQGQVSSAGPFQYIDNGGDGDTIYVKITDANGCVDSSSVILVAPMYIMFNTLVLQADTCSQGVGIIQVTGVTGGSGSGYTYSVNYGAAGTNSTMPATAGFNTVQVFDGNGCASIVDSVNVSDMIGAFNSGSGGTYTSCPGDSVNLVAFGGQNYIWYFANGDTIQWGSPNVNVYADSNKTVYVEVFSGSCVQIDSAIVQIVNDGCGLGEVNNNVFTPDGDGTNDVFVFDIPILIQKKNTVTIYNRWGDVIQQINDYNNIDHVWDGTNSHGQGVPAGTYFYVIDIPEANYTNNGWIQVIR